MSGRRQRSGEGASEREPSKHRYSPGGRRHTRQPSHGRADRLVTREELRRKLWDEKTFVDFEQGLNTAIARLRHALGDSAEHPRFIETVPGRGYRFIAAVATTRSSARAGAQAESERRPRIDRRTWLAGAVGVALGAAGVHLAIPRRRARIARQPQRFIVSGPPGPPFELSRGFQDLAISPDGRRIVYRTSADGAARLYTRALDRMEGRLLSGTDVYNPFFSPDGDEIGYYRFTGRALLRASVVGGPPSEITDVPAFLAGASWSADGDIVLATLDVTEGLTRVPASGGPREALTRPAPGKNHVLPEVLPGGRAVLFTIVPLENPDAAEIAVFDRSTGKHATLTPGSHPRYASSGHLLYVLESDLMAVAFDPIRLRLESRPVTVVRGIQAQMGAIMRTGQYSVAQNGTLLVAMRARGEERRLVWVDRDGDEEGFPAPARGYTYPRISPDGTRIALNMRDSKGTEIQVWNVARPGSTPLTLGRNVTLYPVWTPDGARIAYESGIPLETDLYLKAVDGSSAARLVDSRPGSRLRAPYVFSPSGRELVFAQQGTGGAELWMMTLGDPESAKLLLPGVRNARNADLSPDGRLLAYQSDATGQFEVYVRSFPDLDARYMRVSTNGGTQPLWSPRGDELFYLEPGPPPRLMSVTVQTQTSFALSRPEPLLDWPYYTGELGRTYDVSRPDGRRFLAVKSDAGGGEERSPRIQIVLDWFEELQARLPPS